MNKIAGGKTYSQVSDEWIAGGMKNEKLAGERTTLFMGDTLRGLLLNAWGWGQIGSIAILAGIILIALGAILFLLPVLNWWLGFAAQGSESASRRVAHTPAAGRSALETVTLTDRDPRPPGRSSAAGGRALLAEGPPDVVLPQPGGSFCGWHDDRARIPSHDRRKL